ncbi:chromate transporter [Tumidithrix helvetica PCC 7403]|uniref:chromate transporter n=1 Tax=Tumidithrix helvetica TaxID=3457545 RepID=UPI003C89500C
MTQNPEEKSEEQNVTTSVLHYTELSSAQKKQRLIELAWVFTKLGTTAFGGPAAHIAMLDDEVVKQRKWMGQAKFLDLLGVTNLIPGPNSTELAIHIGLERGGWLGLAIAGVCFILPAMLIVWGLAAVYVQYQALPQAGWLLYGIKPVIVAIVVQALWKLGKNAVKNRATLLTGLTVMILFGLGVNELLLLFLAGLAVMLVGNWKFPKDRLRKDRDPSAFSLLPMVHVPVLNALPFANLFATSLATPTWASVFLLFLKIGSVLYGSGYVLLAFLQKDLVERLHWLTSQQLLDAVAIGQFTPGPVFTTATFIGYLLAGNAGAIAATIGIFLPAFVLVAIVSPWVTKLRRSPYTAGFLDGLNVASLALMAIVTWDLGRAALVDGLTIAVALLSCLAVFRFKVNSTWLVLAGGFIGFIAHTNR